MEPISVFMEMTLDDLTLDRSAQTTLQEQLYQRLKNLIESERLSAAARLPSTRQFAQELGVSRNTINWVYSRLAGEGYINTGQGQRTMVADRSAERAPAPAGASRAEKSAVARPSTEPFRGKPALNRAVNPSGAPELSSFHVGLRPFTPDIEYFPFKTWQKLVARRFCNWGEEFFGYSQLAGYEPLRKAIADYVWANRGVRCDWRQVFITNGAQGGIDLAARMLLTGGDTVWMEEPGYHWAHSIFVERGARIKPLSVDPDEGWRIDPPGDPIKLIYVTPSCQQPLCKMMPLEARRQLLAVAAEKNAWIIEDDFDSEFRGATSYAPAIQGMDDRNRTIYVGTFTKTLFPGLRLGYMVVPDTLVDLSTKMIVASGHFAGVPMQAALADFMLGGYFARHLRKMRAIYAERREAFIAQANIELSEWLDPQLCGAGLQLPFLLRGNSQDSEIARRSNLYGLNIFNLSVFYRNKDIKRNGFILGYAALNTRKRDECIVKFRDIIEEYHMNING
ncbi:MAG: PLP-dependent aminotransferase family protein [Sphingobium sp.]